MNYPYYGNPYMPPMQDNLAQLRQQQMQAIPRLFVARHADIQCCSHHRPLQNP